MLLKKTTEVRNVIVLGGVYKGTIRMRCIKCKAVIRQFFTSYAWALGIRCEKCGQEYWYEILPPKVFALRECKLSMYTRMHLGRRRVKIWKILKAAPIMPRKQKTKKCEDEYY
jgi:hypothetical protein